MSDPLAAYQTPTYSMSGVVRSVSITIAGIDDGRTVRLDASRKGAKEIVVRSGCVKRKLSVWRRTGVAIIAKEFPATTHSPDKLDVEKVYENEIRLWKRKENKENAGYDLFISFYGALEQVPEDERAYFSEAERRFRAESLVARRVAEVASRARLIADLQSALPGVLDDIALALEYAE